jgi:hypothetical protein
LLQLEAAATTIRCCCCCVYESDGVIAEECWADRPFWLLDGPSGVSAVHAGRALLRTRLLLQHMHTQDCCAFFLVSSGGHKCWMSYTSSRKIEEEEEEKSYAKRNGQRAIRWRPVDQQQFLLLFSGSFWPSLSSSSFLSSFDGIHFFRLCLHQPNQTKSIFGRFSFTAR